MLITQGWKRLATDIHWLIKPISNLQRKASVVNMALGVILTTLHFLLNLQMVPII
jgi:hypothetical protein